jgi:hypothetical protein
MLFQYFVYFQYSAFELILFRMMFRHSVPQQQTRSTAQCRWFDSVSHRQEVRLLIRTRNQTTNFVAVVVLFLVVAMIAMILLRNIRLLFVVKKGML